MSQPCVVLYSGGPDSLITLQWAKANPDLDPVVPVYFSLGHRYAAAEIQAVGETWPETIIDSSLGNLGSWEAPDAFIYSRNAMLLIAASRYLDEESPGVLLLSVQKDELELADRRPSFLAEMSKLLTGLRGKFTGVTSPWLEYDKTDMVRWYVERGLSIVDLWATRSCYAETSKPCWSCPACFRRAVAFRLAGVEEPWDVDPFKTNIGLTYLERAEFGHYSTDRCRRILDAFTL